MCSLCKGGLKFNLTFWVIHDVHDLDIAFICTRTPARLNMTQYHLYIKLTNKCVKYGSV